MLGVDFVGVTGFFLAEAVPDRVRNTMIAAERQLARRVMVVILLAIECEDGSWSGTKGRNIRGTPLVRSPVWQCSTGWGRPRGRQVQFHDASIARTLHTIGDRCDEWKRKPKTCGLHAEAASSGNTAVHQ
jgi:hypothetical protein